MADAYNDRVQAFDPDGRYLRRWGGPFGLNIAGPFNGWFSTATSVAVDRDGNVYVADFHNHRIQKFTSHGTFLTAFGQPGSAPGHFNFPTAVAIAEDGSAFVTDLANHRVQKWRPRQ